MASSLGGGGTEPSGPVIGALRTVEQGSLQVLGRELHGLGHRQRVEVRPNMGFIFQAHNLLASLTAAQNVEMAVELIRPTGGGVS